MKIAHFVAVLKKEDGVGLVLRDLARESAAKGDEVMVITGHVDPNFEIQATVVTVPSVALPLYKEYKIPLPGIRGFEKQLSKFQPDILHIHSPEPSAWAALKYAKKYHIPVVATYHTNFGRYLSYFRLSWLESTLWRYFRRLYNKMDTVTSPSFAVSEELVSHGIKNIQTIPWGVDTNRFSSSFRSNEWRKGILKEHQKTIVLYVGRLVWYKDIKTLAETYTMLGKQYSDLAMVVVGDGPARKELEAMMPGALFLGHKQGEELSMLYASGDIFFFPSSTEVFERVTLEAIASDLVPVLADTPAHILTQEKYDFGLLAKTKNAPDFYEKVSSLLEDDRLFNELQSKNKKAVQQLMWPAITEEFSMLYKKVLQKKISE